MPKKITEPEIVMAICYTTMNSWDFTYARRLEWEIWAAKWRVCPTCGAGVGEPCMNLSDKRADRTQVRRNKRPHDERIDWGRLLEGLKQRGYYRPAIEKQVRNRVG